MNINKKNVYTYKYIISNYVGNLPVLIDTLNECNDYTIN